MLNSNTFNKGYYDKQSARYSFNQERKLIFSWHLSKLLKKKPDLKTILDFGCGFGYFLAICDQAGLETYGLEISDYAIGKTRQFTKAKIGKITDPSFLPQKIDAITAFDVLEHLENDKAMLDLIYHRLAKRGVFYGTTPNSDFFLNPLLGKNDLTHINIHNSSYWDKLFKKVGFQKVETKCIFCFGFPPLPSLREKLGLFIIKPLLTPWPGLGQEIVFTAIK